MGFLDGIGDWIKPLISTGVDVYSAYNRDQSRQKLVDEMRSQEDRAYGDAKAQYDAYMQSLSAAGEEGGGGGGGMGAGSGYFGEALSALDPYAAYGPELMARASKMYGRGGRMLNRLNKEISTPEQMALIKQGNVPAYDVQMNLPEWMKK